MLIPKKKNASNIEDFRPINLMGCIYKFLSKVLVNRLSKVLTLIIGKNHQAFVFGWQITDAILIANEVVEDVFKNKRNGVLCKLDMEKAFDHIFWNFVYLMLEYLGFGQKWTS